MVDVLVLKADHPVTFDYRADCPHCGDHSYPVTLKGQVAIGLLDDESKAYTLWTGLENINETIHIRTSKGKKPYVAK